MWRLYTQYLRELIPNMVSGITYFALAGRHLLPDRDAHSAEDLTVDYQLRDYLTELKVSPASNLIGKTIVDAHLGEAYDLTVMGLMRDGHLQTGDLPDAHVQADNTLLVKGAVTKILEVQDRIGITLDPHMRLGELDLKSSEASMIEVVTRLADTVVIRLADTVVIRAQCQPVPGLFKRKAFVGDVGEGADELTAA